MHIGSQYTVGIHTLMLVEFFKDERITSEIAAASIGCNPVIVRNVFSKLSKAGLLRPGRGKAKTALGRPACEITMYDVFTATERCETDEIFSMYPANQNCPIGSELHNILESRFESAVEAMLNDMKRTTIADLVSELPPDKRVFPDSLRNLYLNHRN